MTSLKLKTLSGVKWQVSNKVIQKVISVGTFAVLARILEPFVFGLFAMAFILIDGLAMFQTMGLDSGIIQRKNLTQEDTSTAFFMVQGLGIIMTALCFIVAPIAGAFFENPDITSITRALGLIFTMSCFGRIPQTLLVRDMKFNVTSTIEIVGTITNSIFAILFALKSPTVWALVWAYLIKQSVMTSLTWYYAKFKLSFVFNKQVAKELFHFGKYLVGISFIWYFNANIGMTVVGKILGATLLGYFMLARNITDFVNTHFTQLISRVMFPAYAHIQDDPETLKRAFLKTIKFVSVFTVPFSFGLIIMAPELVNFLYGEKWLAIIPLIQMMGFTQILAPVLGCTGSIYNGCGKPKYSYWLGIIFLCTYFPIVTVMSLKFDLMGTVIAGLMTHFIMVPVNLYYVKKIVDFKISEFFFQMRIPMLSGVCMAIVLLVSKAFIHIHPASLTNSLQNLVALLFFTAIGVITYVGTFMLRDKASALEVKQLLFKGGRA